MDLLINDMATCRIYAKNAIPIIIKLLDKQNCNILDLHASACCFRILLPTNAIVKAVSVSIPPDVNKYISVENFHPCVETALLGFDDKIIYNKGLLYEDGINRFESLQDVADEVKRIIRTVS